MNELVTLIDGNAVTTSLAIAEGTENEHASVILLARKYLVDLEEFGALRFEIEKGKALPQGGFAKATEYAILNEQQSTLLLTYMRNSDIVRQFKKKLVKAFFDLLQKTHKPQIDPMQVLNDPQAMRGLLLNYTEKVLTLETKVEELTPKAEAFEMLSASSDALTYTEAAKVIGCKRKDFVAILHAEGWHYRQNGSWVAYDKYIKNGCLQYKEAKYTDDSTGHKVIKPYCHITQKGLARASILFANRSLGREK